MEFSRDGIEQSLRDTWDTVKAKLEEGTHAVRDSIGRLPFLASVSVAAQNDSVERDEHHYFLVPTPFAEVGYAVYTVRRMPEGRNVGDDLPPLRVFHLPAEGAEDRLADLVLAVRDRESEPGEAGGSIADRLYRVADEIDRHERMVTGGILLIGGAVAISNPLLGVGIAAKALLPSIGALLSREGLKLAGDKLKGFSDRRKRAQQEAADKAARKEFDRIPLSSLVNPILSELDRALRTDAMEFDPSREVDLGAVSVEGWNQRELVQLTARAISETYGDANGAVVAPEFRFGREDRRWIEELRRRSK